MSQFPKSKLYNLEERTLEFGKRIIHLVKAIPINNVNNNLIDQLIRLGTSVGANYREANETITKRDFKFKIQICRKEAKETIYWLQLIMEANPEIGSRMRALLQESEELVKIFATIILKSQNKIE